MFDAMRPAKFVRRTELVSGVWQAWLKPEQQMDYLAGQYAAVQLAMTTADPRGTSRTFTLTSLPGDEHISIVYRADTPMSPYKQALQTLRPGDVLQIGDIMGDLVLPKLPTVPLVFVAGGIGMASFTGMLSQLTRDNQQRTIDMLYSLRSTADDAFAGQVNSFDFRSLQRFIRPNYLTAQAIAAKTTDDSLVYLSGSERFVSKLRDELHSHGLSHSQLVFDYYDGYADL